MCLGSCHYRIAHKRLLERTIKIGVAIFVFPHRLTYGIRIFFEIIVVYTLDSEICAIAGCAIEVINGKCGAESGHIAIAGIYAVPQLLQFTIDHCAIACPIDIIGIYLASLYVGIR